MAVSYDSVRFDQGPNRTNYEPLIPRDVIKVETLLRVLPANDSVRVCNIIFKFQYAVQIDPKLAVISLRTMTITRVLS